MKRSVRLEKFAEINAALESNAGSLLANVQQQYDKQNAQLEKLRAYRAEYQQQLNEKLADSRSAGVIHDYHRFIESIDLAIGQQTEVVRQCAEKVAARRADWLVKRQNVTKMVNAAENLKHGERLSARRAEQKESDELVLNRYSRSQQADRSIFE